jgi:hypothetical protein
MREKRWDFVLAALAVFYFWAIGGFTSQAWKDNFWKVLTPIVWMIFAIGVLHVIVSAIALIDQITGEISPIILPEDRHSGRRKAIPEIPHYRGKVLVIASVSIGLLAIPAYWMWCLAKINTTPSNQFAKQATESKEPLKTTPTPTPEPSKPVPKTPSTQQPAVEMPNVSLRFVSPKSPVLIIVNPSNVVAKEIKWAVVLWNLDLPDRYNPLPIPSNSVDWIKPHDEVGPANLFDLPTVFPLLNPGNRLFGCAMIDCPGCSRGRTYIVYIVWNEGGWYSEINKNHPGKIIAPPNLSKEVMGKYFQLLESMAPPSARTPIGNYP